VYFFGKLKIICLILQREKYSDGFYLSDFYMCTGLSCLEYDLRYIRFKQLHNFGSIK
jgi:hypothetical protein